ncbi:hypothetical protein [Micromonospora chersina]|uniref:hypothetical protein n=1 Tax=Micromonospora chersina TaxID=47854 RepID=UPI003D8B06FC
MPSADAAPARPARPGAVTAAYWLQLAAVAVLLVLVCLVVIEAVRYDAQIDEALRRVPDADPTEVSDERAGNVFGSLFLGVPALLLAVWLAATALPLRRGSNVARILVFVAAGGQVLLCLGQGCVGLLVIPLAFAAGLGDPEVDPSAGDVPDTGAWAESRFLETLYDQGEPGVVPTAIGGIGILLVLTLTAAVVVLLLLPDSRRWFGGPTVVPSPVGPWPGYAYGYGPGHYGWPAPPPGYLICPDPAMHLVHPPTAPAVTAWASPAGTTGPDDGDPGPPGQGGGEQPPGTSGDTPRS